MDIKPSLVHVFDRLSRGVTTGGGQRKYDVSFNFTVRFAGHIIIFWRMEVHHNVDDEEIIIVPPMIVIVTNARERGREEVSISNAK